MERFIKGSAATLHYWSTHTKLWRFTQDCQCTNVNICAREAWRGGDADNPIKKLKHEIFPQSLFSYILTTILSSYFCFSLAKQRYRIVYVTCWQLCVCISDTLYFACSRKQLHARYVLSKVDLQMGMKVASRRESGWSTNNLILVAQQQCEKFATRCSLGTRSNRKRSRLLTLSLVSNEDLSNSWIAFSFVFTKSED